MSARLSSSSSSSSSRHRPGRPGASDVLFALLSLALLIASAFVAGGLAAHPF